MITQLVDESTRKNYFEKISMFELPKEPGTWVCTFCNPSSMVYSLELSNPRNLTRIAQVKRLIRNHLELHRLDLFSQLTETTNYEQSRVEGMKRVRIWISGTINDLQLYQKDPL